jgi:excisionase family DNA binding protein
MRLSGSTDAAGPKGKVRLREEIVMVTVNDLQEVRSIRDELRAHGEEQRAAAIDHLLQLGEAAVESRLAFPIEDLITARQAASALGVSLQTVRGWTTRGKVETLRVGRRNLINRASLVAYLDSLRAAPSQVSKSSETETAPEKEQRVFVEAGFPPALLERLRELIDAMEDRPLTRGEERELQDLERESTRISAERLRAWIEREATVRDGIDARGL